MAKEDRGFASMDPEKRREICSSGGKAAHIKGVAHEWSRKEAREAGRKGGVMAASRRKREQETAAMNMSVEPIISDIPPHGNWPWDH